MDILDSEDAAEDVFIEDDGSALVEERESGLIEAGVSTCVTEVETKYLEDLQQVVNSSYILPYMLKPPSLLTHAFKWNKKV